MNRTSYNFILFCFCQMLVIPLHSQEPYFSFQKIGPEEGLPNNRARTILPDRSGLLWFGTRDGLVQFDGYNYTSFRHQSNDSSSLSGNNIYALCEDLNENIWVGTYQYGLNIFNKKTKKVIRIPTDTTNSSALQSNVIYNLKMDQANRIWIAGNKGLEVLTYNLEEGPRKIPLEDILPAGSPNHLSAITIHCDTKGRVWIGTKKGIYVYDEEEQQLISPESNPDFIRHYIQDIEEDGQGNIWLSCRNKGPRIFQYEESTHRFLPLEDIPLKSTRWTIKFCFDADQRLWLSEHGSGVYVYDVANKKLLMEGSRNSNLPYERFLNNPMVDNSGNIWLAGDGYAKYNYPKGFKNYQHPFDFHQSNNCIYDDGEFLWFAYRERGLVRISHKDNSTVLYTEDAKPGFALHSNLVPGVLRISKDQVVIIPFGAIEVIDLPTGKIRSFKRPGTNRALFQDSKQRIWVGGFGGLYLFSPTEGILKTYKLPQNPSVTALFIQAIVEDKKGNLWIGSGTKGLTKFNPETEEMTPFVIDAKIPHSLPTYKILDLAFDREGILWIATEVGLVKFLEKENKFITYNYQHGLENDFINTMVCTKEGDVWVATNNGIAQFDPVKELFKSYHKSDGLINSSYYPRSGFLAPDGTIYFGSQYGVDYFRPSELRKNPFPPKLSLRQIKVDNKPYDFETIEQEEGLFLSYKQRLIEIEWAGHHYTAPEKTKYFYNISGSNEEWTSSGQERKVILANLPPGDYELAVKACTDDGVNSEKNLILPIVIAPPFWQRWWFRALIIATLFLLIFWAIRQREKRIQLKEKEKARIQHQFDDLEKRALLAQMNPHFIFNAMNSIQQFISLGDAKGAMNYLSRFSRLIRVVLNFSSQSKIALSEEIEFITDYLELEKMRFSNKFSFDIKIGEEVNIHTVEIAPFFIQPLVENAIKHGLLNKKSKGYIHIDIRQEKDQLRVTVEDNGIGREAAKNMNLQTAFKYTGKGLSISKERLKLIQENSNHSKMEIIDLYDSENKASGTKVRLFLPID